MPNPTELDPSEAIRRREAAMEANNDKFKETAPERPSGPVDYSKYDEDDDPAEDRAGVDAGDPKPESKENPRERLRQSMANLLESEEIESDDEPPKAADDVPQDEDEEDPAPDPKPDDEQQVEDDEPEADPEPEEDEPEEEDDEVEPQRLEGKVPDDEWKKLPKVTRQRINHYRRELRDTRKAKEALEESKPYADYGQSVLQFAEAAGIDDDSMGNWLDAGAIVNAGDANQPDAPHTKRAVEVLLHMAKNLGYQEPKQPAKTPEWLDKMVEDYGLPDEAKQQMLQNLQPQAEAPAAPPASQPAPAQQPTGAPRFGRNTEAAISGAGDAAPDVREGNAIVAAKIKAGRDKYKSQWDEIWPEVKKEILKDRGTHPSAWGSLFDKAVDLVVERRKPRKRGPAKKTLDTQGATPERGVDESKMTPRERAQYRARKGKLGS